MVRGSGSACSFDIEVHPKIPVFNEYSLSVEHTYPTLLPGDLVVVRRGRLGCWPGRLIYRDEEEDRWVVDVLDHTGGRSERKLFKTNRGAIRPYSAEIWQKEKQAASEKMSLEPDESVAHGQRLEAFNKIERLAITRDTMGKCCANWCLADSSPKSAGGGEWHPFDHSDSEEDGEGREFGCSPRASYGSMGSSHSASSFPHSDGDGDSEEEGDALPSLSQSLTFSQPTPAKGKRGRGPGRSGRGGPARTPKRKVRVQNSTP